MAEPTRREFLTGAVATLGLATSLGHSEGQSVQALVPELEKPYVVDDGCSVRIEWELPDDFDYRYMEVRSCAEDNPERAMLLVRAYGDHWVMYYGDDVTLGACNEKFRNYYFWLCPFDVNGWPMGDYVALGKPCGR